MDNKIARIVREVEASFQAELQGVVDSMRSEISDLLGKHFAQTVC